MSDGVSAYDAPLTVRRPAVGLPLPGWPTPLAVRRGLARVAAPLALVAIWQAGSSLGLIPSRSVPGPLAILATAGQMIGSGVLLQNLAVSLLRVTAGMAIALALGTALALVAGLSRAGEAALDSTMQMLRTLPFLALVPLFILWFGIGETPKIALVVFGAVFPIYLNLYAGIRSVDPKLLEATGTLGLSRWQTIRHVVLPGALPQALVGLRLAVGIGWLSLVVGEQINAESGIGYLMMDARDFMRIDIIMVGLLVYAIVGLTSDLGVRWLERTVLAWRPAARIGR
jgi:sulfonate transport system permease protein